MLDSFFIVFVFFISVFIGLPIYIRWKFNKIFHKINIGIKRIAIVFGIFAFLFCIVYFYLIVIAIGTSEKILVSLCCSFLIAFLNYNVLLLYAWLNSNWRYNNKTIRIGLKSSFFSLILYNFILILMKTFKAMSSEEISFLNYIASIFAFHGSSLIFFLIILSFFILIKWIKEGFDDNRNQFHSKQKNKYYDSNHKYDSQNNDTFNIYKSKTKYFGILGVKEGAPIEEIKTAYKKKMREYHPDRVNDLGEDIKNLAENKAKRINEAYEALKYLHSDVKKNSF